MHQSLPLSLTHGLAQAHQADLRAEAAHARLVHAVRVVRRDPAPRRTVPALARLALAAAGAAVPRRRAGSVAGGQPCPTC